MRRTVKLNERDLSRIVRRIFEEDEEFDIEKTVMDSGGFSEEDIPEECKGGDNPGMSKVEMITGCIGKITEKSTSISNALTALTTMMQAAETKSSSMDVTESKRYRNYRRY